MNSLLLDGLRRRIAKQGKEQVAKEMAGAMLSQSVGKARQANRKGNPVTAEELVAPLDNETEYMELMASIGLNRKEIKRIAQMAIDGAANIEEIRNSPKKYSCPKCNKASKRQSVENDRAVYKCPNHGVFAIMLKGGGQ